MNFLLKRVVVAAGKCDEKHENRQKRVVNSVELN